MTSKMRDLTCGPTSWKLSTGSVGNRWRTHSSQLRTSRGERGDGREERQKERAREKEDLPAPILPVKRCSLGKGEREAEEGGEEK